MSKREIFGKIKTLIKNLEKYYKNKNKKSFSKVRNIKDNGVYIVFKGRKPIYVGSTSTEGHKRLNDLVTHFSNHTLHRKLLKEKLKLNKKQGVPNSTKKLARKLKMSLEKLVKIDKKVKTKISGFKFVFIKLKRKEKDIKRFEHFVIAVLNPNYND